MLKPKSVSFFSQSIDLNTTTKEKSSSQKKTTTKQPSLNRTTGWLNLLINLGKAVK